MKREQAFERVRQANPLPGSAAGPDGFLSQTALLTRIDELSKGERREPSTPRNAIGQPVERRRDMQTQERPSEVIGKPRATRPRRRLIPALAGALAVIVVAVGVWALTTNGERNIADRTPLEVTDLFNERVVTADPNSDLYAADATWQLIQGGDASPVFRFSDVLPDESPVLDWDGDGQITEMDNFFSLGVELYAGGVTDFLACAQSDTVTAVCDEIREGYAFKNPSHSANWTFTITDGLISKIVIDLVGNGTDAAAVNSYRLWVDENRPELVDDLFASAFLGTQLQLTPDTIETHRQIVAEWQAQRGRQSPQS